MITHVHKEEAPDPNKFLLGFRNEQERELKFKGMVGGFLKGRQAALERYSKEVGDKDAKLSAFYEKKLLVSRTLTNTARNSADSVILSAHRKTDT